MSFIDPIDLFKLQLLISFLTGGALVAGISLLAERVDKNISGIVMMFPSTIVAGFFFLGWLTSASHVAKIVPSTLIPLGLIVLVSAIYIYIARLVSSCVNSVVVQVILTSVICALIWFVLAAPFAISHHENLITGLLGYLALVLLAHQLIGGLTNNSQKPTIRYNKIQLICRSFFMGSVILIIVYLAKRLGVFWGGVFTMFPAATLSMLIFLHYYHGPERIANMMAWAPIGSLSLLAYTLSVSIFFPVYGIALGTLLSYLVSLFVSLILIKTTTTKSFRLNKKA